MNLEVDVGNTRFKWRLNDNEKIIAAGSVSSEAVFSEKSFAGVFVSIDKYQPVKVGVASVTSKNKEAFGGWCQHKWNVTPDYLSVSECALGVVNGYSHVEQMGVDRWLAILAAYSSVRAESNMSGGVSTHGQDCLVVDCGSACTVDMVLANGSHLGGYITPGLQLMRNALFRDTDRVKLDEISYDNILEPGKTTLQAVSSGLWMMQLGLINLSLDRLISEGATSPRVFFTGGAGKHLLDLFCSQSIEQLSNNVMPETVFVPDLVLDGVSLLLARY